MFVNLKKKEKQNIKTLLKFLEPIEIWNFLLILIMEFLFTYNLCKFFGSA